MLAVTPALLTRGKNNGGTARGPYKLENKIALIIMPIIMGKMQK